MASNEHDLSNQDAGNAMIFLSYSNDHSFEADLLKFAYENLLAEVRAKVWTYERDQPRDENAIAINLKDQVRKAKAFVFLVTPSTMDKGGTQWMELAYADAFNVPTFIILHMLTYEELRSRHKHVPPLLLAAQCNPSEDWRIVATELRRKFSD